MKNNIKVVVDFYIFTIYKYIWNNLYSLNIYIYYIIIILNNKIKQNKINNMGSCVGKKS